MGIIEKQATRNAVYSYLGAGLGFLTLLWMPHLMSTDANGLTRILVSISTLFAQFANLGFSSVTIRMFPYFRNKEKGHHGFLFYGIIISIIGFLLCCLFYFIFRDKIIEANIEKSKLLVDYLFYLLPLILFTLFFNLFDNYLRACYQSVAGSFAKDLIQRILILLALCFYYFELISFPVFIFTYVAATCFPTIMLIYKIIQEGEWHVKPNSGFITKDLRNDMLKLSFYSLLSGGAGAVIANIDAIMVNQMLGLNKTGVYAIAFNFGIIISIPARSLYRIATSIVSEAFKKNDMKEIASLYNKSCNSQLMVGLLLFIGIWSNLDNIMRLLPAEYEEGRYVILFIAAGYLVDLGTGINSIIILTSKYYKYDSLFMFMVVAITIIANYILIPIYGITGSAIATAVTISSYNILRLGFIYGKFGMQPYDMNTLKLLMIAFLAFLPGYFIPEISNVILDIAIRSSIVGGLFVLMILKFEASPDFNVKIRKNLKRFGIRL